MLGFKALAHAPLSSFPGQTAIVTAATTDIWLRATFRRYNTTDLWMRATYTTMATTDAAVAQVVTVWSTTDVLLLPLDGNDMFGNPWF